MDLDTLYYLRDLVSEEIKTLDYVKDDTEWADANERQEAGEQLDEAWKVADILDEEIRFQSRLEKMEEE